MLDYVMMPIVLLNLIGGDPTPFSDIGIGLYFWAKGDRDSQDTAIGYFIAALIPIVGGPLINLLVKQGLRQSIRKALTGNKNVDDAAAKVAAKRAAAEAAGRPAGRVGADEAGDLAGDKAAARARSRKSTDGPGKPPRKTEQNPPTRKDTPEPAPDSPPPSTPIGGRVPLHIHVPAGRTALNAPTTIGGRQYSGHAIDRMQERGIMPSVVENTISVGTRGRGNSTGTISAHDPINRIRVIFRADNGLVVTAMRVRK